ncbi:MAG: hypothetical protein HKO79_04865 [Desulfobacterales bacterium]|nr:hypothetical protein [Desulfobacterales bacterium]
MDSKHKTFLLIDGIINLVLGIILLFFPLGLVELIGLPYTNTNFYPVILGAVLFGIGIALLIERYGAHKDIRGLGLGGAIAINLCGAGVLLTWLLVASFDIPLRGHIILWSIAILVLIVGFAELIAKTWRY